MRRSIPAAAGTVVPMVGGGAVMRGASTLTAGLVLLVPRAAAAHAALPATPATVWSSWTLEPPVLIGLGLLAALWARGVARTWRTAGPGRGFTRRDVHRTAVAFTAIAVAAVSPLDAAAEALVSAHMVQHLLLILVAAPLLVRSGIVGAVLGALRASSQRPPQPVSSHGGAAGGRWGPQQLLSAWVLHVTVLWLWHLPVPYEAALRIGAVHALEHATMLGSAVLFWVPVLGRGRARIGDGAATFYLFAFGVQALLLGALLVLADRPSYAGHMPWAATWGLTNLQDQQLAGTLMWVPGAAACLFALARRPRSLFAERVGGARGERPVAAVYSVGPSARQPRS